MANTLHASVIKQKATDTIREASAKSEKDGKLNKSQMGLIYEQNWFKVLTPTAYGGNQHSLPDAVALTEALAWADGSTGWAVSQSALSGWLAAFAGEEAKAMFSNEKAFLAGISEHTGTAEKTADGYTINGKWPYVAGANDAVGFFAGCIVAGTEVARGKEPEIVYFLLDKSDVTISATWNAMGLTATGSQTFEAKNVKVAEDKAIVPVAGKAITESALFKYPFLQLREAIIAANISGMALHFIELCEVIFKEKKNNTGELLMDDHIVKDTFDKFTQKFHDARTKLYYAVELSWQGCVHSQQIKTSIIYKVSAASHDLAKRARECADNLYPFCGMAGMDKNSEINRVWRDLHTAAQHSLLVFGGLTE